MTPAKEGSMHSCHLPQGIQPLASHSSLRKYHSAVSSRTYNQGLKSNSTVSSGSKNTFSKEQNSPPRLTDQELRRLRLWYASAICCSVSTLALLMLLSFMSLNGVKLSSRDFIRLEEKVFLVGSTIKSKKQWCDSVPALSISPGECPIGSCEAFLLIKEGSPLSQGSVYVESIVMEDEEKELFSIRSAVHAIGESFHTEKLNVIFENFQPKKSVYALVPFPGSLAKKYIEQGQDSLTIGLAVLGKLQQQNPFYTETESEKLMFIDTFEMLVQNNHEYIDNVTEIAAEKLKTNKEALLSSCFVRFEISAGFFMPKRTNLRRTTYTAEIYFGYSEGLFQLGSEEIDHDEEFDGCSSTAILCPFLTLDTCQVVTKQFLPVSIAEQREELLDEWSNNLKKILNLGVVIKGSSSILAGEEGTVISVLEDVALGVKGIVIESSSFPRILYSGFKSFNNDITEGALLKGRDPVGELADKKLLYLEATPTKSHFNKNGIKRRVDPAPCISSINVGETTVTITNLGAIKDVVFKVEYTPGVSRWVEDCTIENQLFLNTRCKDIMDERQLQPSVEDLFATLLPHQMHQKFNNYGFSPTPGPQLYNLRISIDKAYGGVSEFDNAIQMIPFKVVLTNIIFASGKKEDIFELGLSAGAQSLIRLICYPSANRPQCGLDPGG